MTGSRRSAWRAAAAIAIGLASVASAVIASGGSVGATGRPASVVVQRTTSTHWRESVAPSTARPRDPEEQLGPVDCLSSGNCVSLGTALGKNGERITAAFTETNGTWSEAPLPGLPSAYAFATPLGVSCSTMSDCVGMVQCSNGASIDIGSISVQSPGVIAIYVESGGTWSVTLAEPPAGATALDKFLGATGLACQSTLQCTLVSNYGTRLVAISGSPTSPDWTTAKIPSPVGYSDPGALALSCTDAGDCVAVGGAYDASGDAFSAVFTETGGDWVAPQVVGTSNTEEQELTSVSCPAAGSCLALGVAGANGGTPIELSESGGTWSTTETVLSLPSGLPTSGIMLPEGLQCMDAGDCLATGNYFGITETSGSGGAISETFEEEGIITQEQSSAWSLTTLPLPAGMPAGTASVAGEGDCWAVSGCAVVGQATTTSIVGVVDTYASGTWTSTETSLVGARQLRLPEGSAGTRLPGFLTHRLAHLEALAGSATANLAGGHPPLLAHLSAKAVSADELEMAYLSCAAADECTTTGMYLDSYGEVQGAVGSIAPSSSPPEVEVTTTSAPVVTGSGFADEIGAIEAVACNAPGKCFAVGTVLNEVNGIYGGLLVDTLRAGQWHASLLAQPSGASALGGVLYGVSCPSSTVCIAVGSIETASGSLPVLATWKQGNWSVRRAPIPRGTGASDTPYLYGLTCLSPRNCTAIGAIVLGNGTEYRGLIDGEVSGVWTSVTAPLPSGVGSGALVELGQAACTTATHCVIVGDYFTASSGGAMVLVGSRRSWKASVPPVASGGIKQSVFLSSVACTSTTCVVAGEYNDKLGNGDDEILTEHGPSFTASKVALPRNGAAREAFANEVACGHASCAVAGAYYTTGGRLAPMLVVGSPGKWTSIEGSIPKDTTLSADNPLEASYCNAKSECAAAGVLGSRQYLAAGSGTHWTGTVVALPANKGPHPRTDEFGIVCPSQTSCVADAQYVTGVGLFQSLLDTES